MRDVLNRLTGFRARLHDARRAAYRELFGRPGQPLTRAQQIVLADLARFGHAETPTWDAEPRAHALREGRREMWLRIQKYRQLSDAEIAALQDVEIDDE